MIKKSKIMAVAVVTAVIFILAACGDKKVEVTENITISETETTAGETETTETEKESKASDADFSIGEINDGVYINKMFNIKFDGNAGGMEFTDKEERNKAFHNAGGEDTDTKTVKAFLDAGYEFSDMNATGTRKGLSVILSKGNEMKDIEDCVDKTIPKVKKELEDVGFGVKAEKSFGKVLGEDMPYISVEASEDGVSMYQKIICLKSGDYMAKLVSYGEDEAAAKEYIDMFTKIE